MRTFLLSLIPFFLHSGSVRADETRPNLIFILSDDVAQGDLGCYGQALIKTPHLDRMAEEGTRYTQAYAGTSVCAPSRTSLVTGLDMGHSPVRGNREIPAAQSPFGAGQLPLPEGIVTVAEILRSAGYATACMGKWGMGQFDTSGSPLKVGFDHFFGYNGQVHAHGYFPTYLHDDEARIELPENEGGKKVTYAPNLIQKDLLNWVRENHEKPFFLFSATTLPHGKYEIDDLGEYASREEWTSEQRTYAAMVARLDRDVGELLDLLAELKIDKNTLVIFAGDNGSSFAEDSAVGALFDQSMGGKLRGHKRSMYEGGLRQAAISRWPDVVPAGRVSDEPWAFWDYLPTASELAGASIPDTCKTTGHSLVSFLKGGPAPTREYFYWELHERGFIQAVRFGDWKAVRNAPSALIELYDLGKDPAESTDLAGEHPELVAKAEGLLKTARIEDPNWPIKEKPKGGKKKP